MMHEPFKNTKWIKYPLGDTAQNFGENKKLYKDSMGWDGGHNGWDGVRPYGEHLFAVESGIVCDVKEDAGGYGKHIRILSEYEKGRYREWTYGHLSAIRVKLGENVTEGQYVAEMGNTGFVVSGDTAYWTGGANKYVGVHLHLNVRELVHDLNGWKYPWDESPKLKCLNYDNGTKGGLDPIPYFFKPRAQKIRALAESYKSTTLYELAVIINKYAV